MLASLTYHSRRMQSTPLIGLIARRRACTLYPPYLDRSQHQVSSVLRYVLVNTTNDVHSLVFFCSPVPYVTEFGIVKCSDDNP